jgi:hypothetical protein
MARGQKGWQKTTAGTFWFSLVVAGLLVVACLFAGTVDFLVFKPKSSRSFVGHFHSCHNHVDCQMAEHWVLAPEVTEISPAVEPVVTELSPGVRICLISPGDANTCIDLPVFDASRITVFDQPHLTDISQASDQEDISLPGIRNSLISPVDVASTRQ